jgi:hypothetical protein
MKTELNSKFAILIWLTIVQQFFFSFSFCQDNNDDSIVLLNAIRKVTSQREIVYVDRVNAINGDYGGLFNRIKEGKISDKISEDSLILSLTEQNYIISQLQKQTIWSDKLFENSKSIDTDSMWTYLRKMNQQRSFLYKEAISQNDTV